MFICLFEHDLFGKPVPTFPDHALEFAVETSREHGDGSAVGVIGGICDELIVRSDRKTLGHRISVIGFQDLFGAVIELAVTDQEAEAAGGEEISVRRRKAVGRAADTDRVIRPTPEATLDL